MDNPPAAENWAAVDDAVRDRLRELKMSKASLERLLNAHLTPLKDEVTRLRETAVAIAMKANKLLPPDPCKTVRDSHEKGITDGGHLRPANDSRHGC